MNKEFFNDKELINDKELFKDKELINDKELFKDKELINDKELFKDKELKKYNKELLTLLSKSDSLLDHSIEECGNCFYRNNLAQVAREMLEKGDTGEGAAKRWEEETEKRWQNSKYYKLWVEEKKAGRDPYKAFEEKGWIV